MQTRGVGNDWRESRELFHHLLIALLCYFQHVQLSKFVVAR